MPTKLTIPNLVPHDAPALHREQNRKLRRAAREHNERIEALAAGPRQAITTTYRGPTDSKGSRVIARCEAKRISVHWDHALDAGANHAAAALQLMDQLGWSERNDLVMGGTRDGYVFVQVPKRGTIGSPHLGSPETFDRDGLYGKGSK